MRRYCKIRCLNRVRCFIWFTGLLTLIACTTRIEPTDRISHIWDLYYNEPETILVVAHRGAHEDVPENSLISIDRAVEQGAHIVELDVRQTKDSVLVIMHDSTVDRTTTGTGNVEDYTYEELKELRLLHHGNPTDNTIPTMEQALMLAKGRILVDVDFKVGGLQARFDAFDKITRLGVEDLVLFFCYDYTELQTLHAYNPNIKIMPRAYDMIQLEEILESGLTDIIHIDGSYYDSISIGELIEGKNVRLWANVLGDYDQAAAKRGPEAYLPFFDKMRYVNVIQTDYPRILAESIGAKR